MQVKNFELGYKTTQWNVH